MKSLFSVDEACKLLDEYLKRIGLAYVQHETVKQAFKDHYVLQIIFNNGSVCSIPTNEY